MERGCVFLKLESLHALARASNHHATDFKVLSRDTVRAWSQTPGGTAVKTGDENVTTDMRRDIVSFCFSNSGNTTQHNPI